MYFELSKNNGLINMYIKNHKHISILPTTLFVKHFTQYYITLKIWRKFAKKLNGGINYGLLHLFKNR